MSLDKIDSFCLISAIHRERAPDPFCRANESPRPPSYLELKSRAGIRRRKNNGFAIPTIPWPETGIANPLGPDRMSTAQYFCYLTCRAGLLRQSKHSRQHRLNVPIMLAVPQNPGSLESRILPLLSLFSTCSKILRPEVLLQA